MSFGNENKLTDKMQVVMSNKVIEARYMLPLGEQKLVLTLASKIKNTDTDFQNFELSAKEFSELLGLKNANYKTLKKAGSNLLDRKIEIETDEFYMGFHWFSEVLYKKNEGILKLKLHEKLKPFFMFVLDNREYTKFYLENVLHFNSVYSIRIYGLLKQYLKIGIRLIKVDEFKSMLKIKDNEYKLYSDFKKRVIEQAYKEINEKSDIRIEFKEIKSGRKIISIEFYIKSKSAYDEEQFSSFDILPKDQLTKLLQLEIQNRYVIVIDMDLIESYRKEVILRLLKDLKKGNFDKTNIYSPKGFFKWQLDEITSMFQENKK